LPLTKAKSDSSFGVVDLDFSSQESTLWAKRVVHVLIRIPDYPRDDFVRQQGEISNVQG
jgi:hypothetical protein